MLLAIDSSAGASAAVLDSGAGLSTWRTAATTTHAEVLAAGVRDVLTRAGLDPVAPQRAGSAPSSERDGSACSAGEGLAGVVVGVGPGPFTGLRVGLVLAHTLAEVWSLPLYGVCSLDSLALRAVEQGLVEGSEEFHVAVDARRREVYSARYRVMPDARGGRETSESLEPPGAAVERLEPPQVGPAAALPQLPVVGVGATLYPDQLTAVAGTEDWTADAAEIGRLGADPAHRLAPQPLYLRESDAKVPAPRKRAGT